MRLWIDADATPRDVKEIVLRAARKRMLDTIFVANAPVSIPANATTVSTVVVRQGANIADQYIAHHSQPGDVAVTADIPLAAILVDKGLYVIDPRGDQLHADNIRSRLATRDFFESVRASGIPTLGPNAYGDKERKAFADALDRVLTRLATAAKRASSTGLDRPGNGQV